MSIMYVDWWLNTVGIQMLFILFFIFLEIQFVFQLKENDEIRKYPTANTAIKS